ncbi:MAG: class I SAM-dependent methyltransferase [Sphingosinicella sp.]|uniref:class I SAM-dependent methyltransferase n=1 Tax=Sphingosinicella sp. TaxID=1917971 RepID=UPI004037FB22
MSHRNDLRITGVDLARVPVRNQAHLTIHAPVNMEALPFGDRGFDAAVSQFGIEYGNIVDTARELERVLIPGARFCFLVHHRDSEIVREGSARRLALRELTSGQIKSAFLSGSVKGVDQQHRHLKKLFPAEPMVKLVNDHFHHNIARTRAERQAVWRKLSDDLNPEIWLLLQLDRSAKSAAEMGSWLVPLLSTMTSVGASIVRRGSGEPIAWKLHGTR